MAKPNITFEILREIAETASGMRNQAGYFVISGDPVGFRFSDSLPNPLPPDAVVIPCNAVNDPKPSVSFAEIGFKDGNKIDLLDICVGPIGPHPAGCFAADAVFWSVSAVEKFVVPYYASVYGDQGPEYTQRVLDLLLREPESELADPPFAVAHLPSSEYVPVEEGMFVPHLAMITRAGAHRLTRAPQGPAPRARTNGSRKRYARSSGR